jgi:extracellular matrix regulatory protein A
MKTTLLNIGFGNAVVAERIIAVITPSSASGKRLREEARENNLLIDATHGRKTRSIIIMDSNHIVLSAMQPETLSNRLINNSDN